jgi:hypothetical protein
LLGFSGAKIQQLQRKEPHFLTKKNNSLIKTCSMCRYELVNLLIYTKSIAPIEIIQIKIERFYVFFVLLPSISGFLLVFC